MRRPTTSIDDGLLKLALKDRDELLKKLHRLNKVIDLLGGETKPSRSHNEVTRKKMKDAWKRRKEGKNVGESGELEERTVGH